MYGNSVFLRLVHPNHKDVNLKDMTLEAALA